MKDDKTKRREAKKSLSEARAILVGMEQYLGSKDAAARDIAYAFLHVLNHHLDHGDLRPSHVHLAALLRKEI